MIVSPLDGTHYLIPQWMSEESAEVVGKLADSPSLSIISLKQLALLVDKDLLKDKSFSGGQMNEQNQSQSAIVSVPAGRCSADDLSGEDSGGGDQSVEPVDNIGTGRGGGIWGRGEPKGGGV
jgi:hypothetical protein